MKKDISSFIYRLQSNYQPSIIHGDFCLSNILFDLNSFVVKLIDPRGSFGSKGIGGDPRYDIAKLRHSIVGLYDFIVHDLFSLEKKDKGFKKNIFRNDNSLNLQLKFDELIIKWNYDLREIKFIEALLFLSMIPLHNENKKRQLFFYLHGIEKLNKLFYENSH